MYIRKMSLGDQTYVGERNEKVVPIGELALKGKYSELSWGTCALMGAGTLGIH